uniref:Protein kinase domain-containing protein n=1 Tax=Arcella intermedia TaxID=1963864 RepID=A0A6B2L5R1_9EUKA
MNFHRKISICKNVFESLKWLHEKEVVHGRLKLSNVLLVNESKAKVADYGLGIPVLNGSTDWKYCFHNYTLHFMAPEVIADSTKLSFKSDYWSLGLVVLALFSEKLPFEGKSIDQLKNEISGFNFSKKVNHNSSLPPTLLQVMLDLLEVKPENRTFPKEEVWSTIVQEATFQGTELSHSIWAKARVKSPSRSLSKDIASNDETVLWSQLKSILSEQLIQERSNLSLSDPLLEKIFLLFLNIPEIQLLGSSLGEIRVSKQIFYKLVEFSNAPAFQDLLTLAKSLSQEPWFYGWAPRNEVEAILNVCHDHRLPRNPFIVRLSTNSAPSVISFINSQQGICHSPLEPKEYNTVGFFNFIKDLTKTKKVKPVDGHKRHTNCFKNVLVAHAAEGNKKQTGPINGAFSKNV